MGMGTKLELRRCKRILSLCLLFSLFVGIPSAAPLSLSELTATPSSRRLLQAQQDCPLNIQDMNYTIVTSRCKGPKYPKDLCCDAFKDLACPYADQLNDVQNNCATTLFSYINIRGNYPPGLFANDCRDSKRGLECSASQSKPPRQTSSAIPSHLLSLLLVKTLVFATLCLQLLWHL